MFLISISWYMKLYFAPAPFFHYTKDQIWFDLVLRRRQTEPEALKDSSPASFLSPPSHMHARTGFCN